jgi:hypothetical protein
LREAFDFGSKVIVCRSKVIAGDREYSNADRTEAFFVVKQRSRTENTVSGEN